MQKGSSSYTWMLLLPPEFSLQYLCNFHEASERSIRVQAKLHLSGGCQNIFRLSWRVCTKKHKSCSRIIEDGKINWDSKTLTSEGSVIIILFQVFPWPSEDVYRPSLGFQSPTRRRLRVCDGLLPALCNLKNSLFVSRFTSCRHGSEVLHFGYISKTATRKHLMHFQWSNKQVAPVELGSCFVLHHWCDWFQCCKAIL